MKPMPFAWQGVPLELGVWVLTKLFEFGVSCLEALPGVQQ